MPKDKTASHEKIIKAAMTEFLEKGYEQASVKAVADAVGLTSAALYRHFENKQDMFAALVQPAVDAVTAWSNSHVQTSNEALDAEDASEMWEFDGGFSDARLVLDVMYEMPDAFRLLLFCSAGTPYEHFLHEMITQATDQMMEFVAHSKAQGHAVMELSADEMHMLVTAYCMALIEPLEHGYTKEEAEHYLKTMVAFFTPGWRIVTGV